jgi:hypothetical protein
MRAAAPKPTIPATFSVPARRPRSCGPPVASVVSASPRRIQSAPTPVGPPSLCADSERQSTPRRADVDRDAARRLRGVGVHGRSASRERAAISATGARLPTSPFAEPTLTTGVPSPHASTTSSTATCRRGRRRRRGAPRDGAGGLQNRRVLDRGRDEGARRATHREGQVVRLGGAAREDDLGRLRADSAATSARARSTSVRTARPSRCALDGLPGRSRASTIAARASGRSGALAL